MSTSNLSVRRFGGGSVWNSFIDEINRIRAALHSPGPGPLWSKELDYVPPSAKRWRNWAGNQTARPADPRVPKDETGVIDIIKKHAGRQIRVLGAGYSFSPLVPADDCILDVSDMTRCSVDKATRTVTAEPGTTISQMHRALVREGLCFETAPVIPWVTVGGALGTGVHGAGRSFGTLSDLVVEARAVDAKGDVHVVGGPKGDKLTDEGRALGCNLGAIGVVTSVTFQAVDLFHLEVKDDTRNYWLETTMLDRDGLRSLLTEAEYFSALWWPGTERCWIKKSNRTAKPPTTTRAQYFLEQLGIALGAAPVTWIGKVLAEHPDWTPIFTALLFDAIRHQEYVSRAPDAFHFLTRYPKVWDMQFAFDVEGNSDKGIDRVVDAWKILVRKLDERRSRREFPLNMAVHMRQIGSSNSLLSPANGHNGSVALEIVTLHGQQERVWAPFFGEIEKEWLDLGGRPHWGKIHGWYNAGGSPQNPDQLAKILHSYGSNVDAFRKVREEWDPHRLFRNRYTDALGL